MTFRLRTLVAIVALVSLSGCSSRHMYDWGSYEPSIDRMYNAPESFRPEEEIELLANELERTPPARIPPGKAAHVGYLYLLKGDVAAAKALFLMEKRLFPESDILMDRLVRNASNQRKMR